MKHVLILDTNPLPLNSRLMDLPENCRNEVMVEEVKYIYQVIRKLLFRPKDRLSPVPSEYDLLIVGLTSTDEDYEKVNFIRYIKRNKPELPLLIFSHKEKDWLIRQLLIIKNHELAPITDRRDIREVVETFLERGILD
ncbi:hypothetical protein DYBT9275_02496 [Dyadobacter sp. CECT 9275]|uniref:Uncharacterized protein n=1 Tax=Dyadobacter helix TaxID=2822344 RepID=A0A916JD65_9BACT|nr:hypothetical protein [Dyadobacter sp. CECT 9275]CAG5000605.1 hypothetical protein DYBT9275_02496 [Dyadobacter sp. CECT 9275]